MAGDYTSRSDQKEIILFDKNNPTQSKESREFEVLERPVMITHYNPIEGEYVCLARLIITGCGDQATGDMVMEKDDCCNFQCLCCACNKMIIDLPGRYKLLKNGMPNNSLVTMRYLSNRYVKSRGVSVGCGTGTCGGDAGGDQN